MVDDDLGFTFALADALASRGIALVPARSVTQARSLFKSLKPNVGLLIINCRVHGVCALAAGGKAENCGAPALLLTRTWRSETCLWKSLKRRSFPVFGFSGRWNLTLGRRKRKLPEKKLGSEEQDLGVVNYNAGFSSQNGNPS